ncbi:MAG TPA: universal stress protein [Candidatus Dormibacteraeota bacterium]|nr:universal stress protein [Candidatus Dormibacteraeota bacterium]
MNLKKILIAVDDSPQSKRARELGVELANAIEAEIAFVYVFDASATPAGAWGFPADRIRAMSELQGKRLLDKFLEGLPQKPVSKTEVREFLESGSPAESIVRVAKKWGADLIVMGSRGRGKVKGILLGSVSQDVLSNSPCPVLVAPPES